MIPPLYALMSRPLTVPARRELRFRALCPHGREVWWVAVGEGQRSWAVPVCEC